MPIRKNNLKKVKENTINTKEKGKSTELVAENEKDHFVNPHINKTIRKGTKKFIPIDEDDFESEEVQDEEKVTLPPSSKRKVIGKGGRVKSPVVEESELEDDSDLYEEEEEVTPPPSSKRKVICKGGKIVRNPVVKSQNLKTIQIYMKKRKK